MLLGVREEELGRGAGHALGGVDSPEVLGRSLGSYTAAGQGAAPRAAAPMAGPAASGAARAAHGSDGLRVEEVRGAGGGREGAQRGASRARTGEMLGTWSLSGSRLGLFSSTCAHVY